MIVDATGDAPVRVAHGARRLHDEDVGAADVLVDLKRDLRVRKPPQPRLPDRHAEKLRDLARQFRMGAAREYFQLAEPGRHERIQCCSTPGATSRSVSLRSNGWGGRIRTFEYGIQSPAPYRLATPQQKHKSLSHRHLAVGLTPREGTRLEQAPPGAFYAARGESDGRGRGEQTEHRGPAARHGGGQRA